MPGIAFFDVDETLIRTKSMFALLKFYLRTKGNQDSKKYDHLRAEIAQMASSGASRTTINKHYYLFWKGEKLVDINAAGQAWFESERQSKDFFIEPAVNALNAHKEAGCLIAMVSGSFESALLPIAKHLVVDCILCSRPEVHEGIMTGVVHEPMIGTNKAYAARKLMKQHGVSPQECFAYGDHLSDIDLLEQVGNPGIVANDPELIAVATARNWKILQ